ncbi:FCD domain-containing protein [Conexibacter stalactiti]|uniref:FCD domain-containing protein n=1 Tax=Conexibacter stalactiti TaxID=1940611 RepID=A0ABU4HLS1_9ACTN|nr:FCD domain-containing protein [Conexibacter stalactiti]MDW5594251.1 FCD domain-containing protein [Conexibacter stalactiti]MEC5034893.1 FCD domain-containing protein [Conexibacter stalactiti]
MRDAPSQIRTPRTGELVAAKLRKRIITGDLRDGDEIPPEPELLAEFGVSRPSIRDAFRILETEGLIRIRRGRFGGATVLRPNAQSAAYHLGLALQAEGTTMADLAEARGLLEPLCAALCAGHAERERIADELDAVIDSSDPSAGDSSDFTADALRFHTAIVDRCGSTTLRLLAGALESVWGSQERRWALEARDAGRYPSVEDQRAVNRAHRAVVRHIRAGRAEQAQRAMAAHLHTSQTYVSPGEIAVDVVTQPAG